MADKAKLRGKCIVSLCQSETTRFHILRSLTLSTMEAGEAVSVRLLSSHQCYSLTSPGRELGRMRGGQRETSYNSWAQAWRQHWNPCQFFHLWSQWPGCPGEARALDCVCEYTHAPRSEEASGISRRNWGSHCPNHRGESALPCQRWAATWAVASLLPPKKCVVWFWFWELDYFSRFTEI